ncbi:hypothetical protein HUE56_28095 (plasmid) [Azospirillum oryzae]|uniref:KfrA N-terminal DNA-binding domain-containing protein n=2 Tax=Azospirillum oryzae TaxID=286727 RepID=A0A6N1AVF3_9PROT|nr:hypothetical protein [Azospirillum oryzae]KAA0584839.1 hypothetical protein FZ938_27655 [Azospirillum oryzae]QKS54317.1 hypothetical protein HUE56_28095 [Azospirillum oryzae]
MAKLLAGTSQRTDGKLTWHNVYTEAGIPRATAARAKDVITEWQEAVRTRSQSDAQPLPSEQTQRLKEELDQRTQEAAATHQALRETIRIMANQIQALSLAVEQKDATIANLRAEVAAVAGNKVVPMKAPRHR